MALTKQGAAHNGKIHEFTTNEIDESIPLRTSSMPDGLLDDLTLEEVIDLFAFLDDLQPG